MKEALYGYGVVVLGIFVIVVMMIIRDFQTTDDQDFYVLKEVTSASMMDSVDYAYYREHNDLRIIEEKFVENFLRRFAQSMSSNKTYDVRIYKVNEVPPEASIKVVTATGEYQVDADEGMLDFGVINLLSGILDMKHNNVVEGAEISEGGDIPDNVRSYTYYSFAYSTGAAKKINTSYEVNLPILPDDTKPKDVVKCEAESVSFFSSSSDISAYSAFSQKTGQYQTGGTGANAVDISKYSYATLASNMVKPSNGTASVTYCTCNNSVCRVGINVNVTNLNGVSSMNLKLLNGSTANVMMYGIKYKLNLTVK